MSLSSTFAHRTSRAAAVGGGRKRGGWLPEVREVAEVMEVAVVAEVIVVSEPPVVVLNVEPVVVLNSVSVSDDSSLHTRATKSQPGL